MLRNWSHGSETAKQYVKPFLFWVYKKENQRGYRLGYFLGRLRPSHLPTLGADRGAWLVYEFGTGVKPLFPNVPAESHDHHPEH